MGKQILLIGVSESALDEERPGLSPAVRNVEALRQTLLAEIEDLRDDQVAMLINPNVRQMRHEIALLSYRCRRGDLCLIYFAGCGIIDAEAGLFYLAAHDTQITNLARTAVSSRFIQQALPARDTLSRVTILDCCWGALPSKNPDISRMTLTNSLPGLAQENGALLTMLGSVTRPWPLAKSGLSRYTQSVIDGIETGLADLDADGEISVSDLHGFLHQSLSESSSERLSVALYAPGESAQISLMQLPAFAPEREYRRSVEEYVHRNRGYIKPAERDILEFLRRQLGITFELSQSIEETVMQPYEARRDSLEMYRQAFEAALQLENPIGVPLRKWLKHLQGNLALDYDDVSTIEAQVLMQYQEQPQLQPETAARWLEPATQTVLELPARAVTVEQNGHRLQ
ncbi:MAG: hypothetical protein F6J97_04365 [Leptolyngbya sp. SIO4C1]|nr:hypothetical protein [Leptolyngbya sp. SIO4C1]